jgi:hypothetical protein
MNKQEQVVDILRNTGETLFEYIGDFQEVQLDNKVIGLVARKIIAIFQPTQKDTRSRREQALDAEFERMGVKPRIFHIISTDLDRFNAVTIAQPRKGLIYPSYPYQYLFGHIAQATKNTLVPATATLNALKALGLYGVAICDKSDVFSRRYGRNKAKGKLMQQLLKEQKK